MGTALKPNKIRHCLSFSRRLFLSVILLFLIFAGSVIAYQYQREKTYKIELLNLQLQNYNEGLYNKLQTMPDSLWTSFIDSYMRNSFSPEKLRVTLIDLQGKVFYDSSKDNADMENHLNRPEVRQARHHSAAPICQAGRQKRTERRPPVGLPAQRIGRNIRAYRPDIPTLT